ncbi:SGNH/GDSL hydrolase family protein [Streptomyces sp. NBC_00091]|uniref:SGNH/GDSL hydrolase family protein n=1 Tax=Streptomyces sp. NBC_00091 TaxID=2975648 RepID=UPI00225283AD|nr:SGNH/GDSL hydrolase family protein [Streptomyces sp. NBC_00091]MCX5380616.1 SGNH/GDSL hydrolase family protein [Streptomyces sp. NBC_00091]
MNTKKTALAAPLAAALLAVAAGTVAATPAAAHHTPWRSSWGASAQAPTHTDWFPNWSEEGFRNQSVRQVVRAGAEGSELRVRLTNAYGKTPLRITGATVARSAGGAAVQPESVRPLRFGGAGAVSVPAGGELSSDAVALPVKAFEQLTVTLWFQGPTGPATFHNVAMGTSYRADGNHLRDTAADAFSGPGNQSYSWYYLAGVDVKNGSRDGARRGVVTFGDSLTDGFGATPGADRRYPDALAARLAGRGRPEAVLNAGLAGSKVLSDSPCFGESALHRFRRDALGRPDTGTVIVLQGTNDIIQPDMPQDRCTAGPRVTAQEIIAGHRELIREAHARGVRILGGTIPPYGGATYWNAPAEGVRNEVNEWIRTSGSYDGVVDFDRAVADPRHPQQLKAELAFADRLHLNDAGYRAMADAVDLNAL